MSDYEWDKIHDTSNRFFVYREDDNAYTCGFTLYRYGGSKSSPAGWYVVWDPNGEEWAETTKVSGPFSSKKAGMVAYMIAVRNKGEAAWL